MQCCNLSLRAYKCIWRAFKSLDAIKIYIKTNKEKKNKFNLQHFPENLSFLLEYNLFFGECRGLTLPNFKNWWINLRGNIHFKPHNKIPFLSWGGRVSLAETCYQNFSITAGLIHLVAMNFNSSSVLGILCLAVYLKYGS